MSINPIFYWLFSFLLLIAANHASADIVRQSESPRRQNEIDTADQGGQIGGLHLGRGYELINLRCAAGEAIVGLETRRGSVLDYVRINCARPVCDNRGCQWSSQHSGAAAGNSGGGNFQPPMMCAQNEIVSGIRGRSVTFTVFDYAANIQIECSPIAAPPTAEGFIALGQAGGGGGYGFGSGSEGSRGLGRSAPTGGATVASCSGYGFGATAVAVGESDFVRRGQRVVQAVSLFCPRGASSSPASDIEIFIDAMDRCLRDEGRLVYYSSPNRRAYTGTATYNNSSVFYDSTFLGRNLPYMKALWLADAFAAHVLSLRERIYGIRKTGDPLKGDTDVIVGFLMSCLRKKENLLQKDAKDPRIWFYDFRSRYAESGSPPSAIQRREEDFDAGWQVFWGGLPRSITMEDYPR
ncbi:MAG: hypothetical protein WCH75_27100 [Candidatus Binatia bacterium]